MKVSVSNRKLSNPLAYKDWLEYKSENKPSSKKDSNEFFSRLVYILGLLSALEILILSLKAAS